MKCVFSGFVLISGLLGVGAATAATKQFEGIGHILTVKNCGTDWAVGNTIIVRYTPSGLTDNPNNSRLTIFNQTFAQAYTTASGRFTTGLSNVNTMFIGGGFGPAQTQATLALSVTSAADTSVYLTISRATITQFGDTPDCIVTFRAPLGLR